MTKLRNTWFALLALVALLAVASVSCGPSGNATLPTDGDIEVHIIVDGPGRVIVDSSPNACRDDCLWTGDSSVYTHFEAVPAPGYVFVAWEGTCDAFENPCIRTFADGDTITAIFSLHALRLDLSGDGQGSFSIQGPPGISVTCTDDCGLGLDQALAVSIYAVPSSDRTAIDEAWSGPCDPTTTQGNYCLVEVTGLTTVGKTWRHPPVAVDDTYGTTRNATLSVSAGQGVLANDDDTPGDTLTAELVTDVTHGTLTLAADGGFSYTPEPVFTGPATFTYRARDAFGNVSNTAPVTITVTQVNRPPVAEDDAFATEVDTQLVVPGPGVLANDTDPDGDALTAILVESVDHGELTLAADGSFSYEPDDDFAGTDTFTYAASDGELHSDPATVTITVTQANRPPVAEDDSYATTRNDALVVDADEGVLANDTDPDGDPLTAHLIRGVDHGVLVLAADGSFSYEPDDDFTGTDTFTYVANDGIADSNTATVTITVSNGLPIAVGDSYSTVRDTTLRRNAGQGVLANDIGVDLTADLVDDVEEGDLTLRADGSFTYESDDDFLGDDIFTYRARDAFGNVSNIATVTITITRR